MTAVLVAAGFVIAAAVYYLLFGGPRFVTDIGNMTPRERADVLLRATIWRLRWERDNPHLPEIFLDPASYPPEVCKKMAREIFDMWFELRQTHKAGTRRLRALGVKEKLPDADVNGIAVWGVTLGARGGQVPRKDMLQLWTHLQEAIPYIDLSTAALMEQRELAHMLGHASVLFGLDAQHVMREARRIPPL